MDGEWRIEDDKVFFFPDGSDDKIPVDKLPSPVQSEINDLLLCSVTAGLLKGV